MSTKRLCASMENALAMVQQERGPGSASRKGPSHIFYGGSRQLNQRWEYTPNSGAGFIECTPQFHPTGDEFLKRLRDVPGVTNVEFNSSKTSQNNIGKHYMEHNVFVTSEKMGPDSVRHPMEFELTRSNHMENLEVPFTLTAMFKKPSPDLAPEAWRILRAVTAGHELFPDHVEKYQRKL